MTRHALHTLLAFLLALPAAWAQQPYLARTAILASSFDLDGEAADPDQVVLSSNLVDSASFTITADPDICRLVDITVTDANSSISAGVLTVTGFDCWGYPLSATFTFAAGGSGVKTLVVIDTVGSPKKASGAFFSDVTTASVGVLTGEDAPGTDLVTIGYTGNSPKGWPLYGTQNSTPSGRRWVDIFGTYGVPVLVINGAATTDITAVAAATSAPFQNVAVGDMLIFNINGEVIWRKVTTRTDADNVIVNSAVVIPAGGVTFVYKKLFFSTDPQDGWIPVQGYDVVTFVTEVDANASTGGVITSVECASFATSDPPNSEVEFEVDTMTVATGATGEDLTTVDLRLASNHTHCRSAVKFGTGDDADAAPEDIDIVLGIRK